jgi:hypothetical protein
MNSNRRALYAGSVATSRGCVLAPQGSPDGRNHGPDPGRRPLYPITDELFIAEVRAVVDAWADGEITARSLGRRLAGIYPAIKVVQQEPLAALGTRPILYVYRDGHP